MISLNELHFLFVKKVVLVCLCALVCAEDSQVKVEQLPASLKSSSTPYVSSFGYGGNTYGNGLNPAVYSGGYGYNSGYGGYNTGYNTNCNPYLNPGYNYNGIGYNNGFGSIGGSIPGIGTPYGK